MHARLRFVAMLGAFVSLAAACSSSTSSSGDGLPGASDGGSHGGSDAGASADGAPSADGGGASDAGGGDGGRDFSTNRGLFFGATRCAQAKVELCEDFESGTLDTATWSVVGTKPTVDALQAARGQRALHISLPGNGASMIRESKTFPAVNDTYWGRIFVYFQSLPTAPGMSYAHWTFAYATGTQVPWQIRLSGQLQSGVNHFGVGTDARVDGGTGDWTTSDDDPTGSPMPVPSKAWTCIEWLHKGDTNETRFYWDAVEHASLHTTSTKHGGNTNPYVLPQFTDVAIGFQEYQTSSVPFEMWVDEIAIDKERIGCVL